MERAGERRRGTTAGFVDFRKEIGILITVTYIMLMRFNSIFSHKNALLLEKSANCFLSAHI